MRSGTVLNIPQIGDIRSLAMRSKCRLGPTISNTTAELKTVSAQEETMNLITLVSLVTIAISATGCASVRGSSSAKWPWSESSRPCAAMNSCNAGDAIGAFEAASNYCRSVQNYYESGGRKSDTTQFMIGAVGAIAGTVIAPIAKGSAATAWSGLSGATNAVQLSMEDTFSTSLAVKRRGAVVAAATQGSAAYMDAPDENTKVLRAIDMARRCSMAGAEADQSALQSLAK